MIFIITTGERINNCIDIKIELLLQGLKKTDSITMPIEMEDNLPRE